MEAVNVLLVQHIDSGKLTKVFIKRYTDKAVSHITIVTENILTFYTYGFDKIYLNRHA